MRRFSGLILTVFVIGLAFSSAVGETVRSGPVTGRFVVKLKRGAEAAAIGQAAGTALRLTPAVASAVHPQLNGGEGFGRIFVAATDSGRATAEGVTALLGADNVEWVEPDYYIELFDLPTDSLFPYQWYLLNEGQEYYGIERIAGYENDTLAIRSGTAGKDIRLIGQYLAPRPDTAGKVVVGILDTGVDTEHPEMAGRIWRNIDEIPGNNTDDDRNGYVDDTVGYDVSGDTSAFPYPVGDADPSDDDGHGSHLAGIVAANADGRGIAGIAPWVEIMPVKIMPNGTTAIGAEAIVYAVNNGARIINISWGTYFQSQVLQDALNFARRNGVLVCIAAGNSGDNTRFYPAAFDLDSTLVVGAGNSNGDMTDFSTYGAHLDIIAPGLDILSLRGAGTDMYGPYPAGEPEVRIIEEQYYLADGTSMAAPMVAGAAALMQSYRPDLALDELIEVMLHGATDLVDPRLQGDSLPGPDTLCGWGYLNIDASLGLLAHGGLYIAAPEQRSRHTGAVAIKGGAIGDYAGGWVLEYAAGQSPTPDQWVTLAAGAGLPADSILATFDGPDIEGIIALRLSDDFGHSSTVTFTYVRWNTLELTSPVDGQELEYNIPIYGSAYGPDYDSLVIRYRSAAGIPATLANSTAEYFDSLFFAWSVSGADTGAFTIYAYGYFADSVLVDSAMVTIKSSFAAGWPRLMPGRGAMTAICCDLNGDGAKELAAATTSGLIMYRADDGTIVPGFPVLTGRDVRCVPAVYDIDRDGEDEIIITDSTGIHVYNPDGTTAEGWPQACYTGLIPYEYAYPTPVVAQFRSAAEEGAVPDSGIIIINKLGQLAAYRFNGDRYFFSREMFGQFDARISFSYGLGGGTSPFVTSADLDGDDRIEIIAAFTSPDPYTGLGLFSGANGEPAFDLEVPTAQTVQWMSGVALADLDGDGRHEVIVSGIDTEDREHIWIRTKDNQPFGDWIVPVEATWNGWLASYPVAADLDLDGTPEILATYFEFDKSSLFIYRADGTPYLDPPRGIPGEALYTSSVTFGTPAVADLLGDEYPEIIIRSGHLLPGTGAEEVYILDYMAEPVPGWPKATPAYYGAVASSRQAALVDDIDNDGLVEMALISDDARLLVWNFEASSRGGTNQFRYLNDNLNSGKLAASATAKQGERPSRAAGSVAEAPSGYPNPFRETATLRFEIAVPAMVRVEVFDIQGRLVATVRHERMAAGEHEVTVDGSGPANGTYFYRVTADGAEVDRGMLWMK